MRTDRDSMGFVKRAGRPSLSAIAIVLCSGTLVAGQYSRLVNASGETVLSPAFLEERSAAEKAAQLSHSVEPLLKLLEKYRKPEETAELELTIGMVYGQRTGLVNPAQSVVHLTSALKYALPEDVRLQALVWRADALARLGQFDDAMKDRVRVLLAVSYRDLSGGCPEIKQSALPISNRSDDPENERRRQDYQQYRAQLEIQQHLLMDRYSSIEAIRGIQRRLSIGDEKILVLLNELSPDRSRHEIVLRWLKAENPRPC